MTCSNRGYACTVRDVRQILSTWLARNGGLRCAACMPSAACGLIQVTGTCVAVDRNVCCCATRAVIICWMHELAAYHWVHKGCIECFHFTHVLSLHADLWLLALLALIWLRIIICC
jgi:hypothetical protein